MNGAFGLVVAAMATDAAQPSRHDLMGGAQWQMMRLPMNRRPMSLGVACPTLSS